MPSLRITYRVSRVDYQGESVGDDWTLFVHTGAGLVRMGLRLRVGDGRTEDRVIAVRELQVDDEAIGTAEAEPWWVSAVEADPSVCDEGVGVIVPVLVVRDEGAEHRRVLSVRVAEAGRGRAGPVATLRVELTATVTRAEGPPEVAGAVPVGDRRGVPVPTVVAGAFPETFAGRGRGVYGPVPVVGTRVLVVEAGAEPDPADPLAVTAARFLAAHTGAVLPPGFTPRLALYRLRCPTDEPMWIGETSSMGQDGQRDLLQALGDAWVPLSGAPAGFEERSTLLGELLADATTATLGEKSAAAAALVAALTEDRPGDVVVERTLHGRATSLDEFTGAWDRAVFVDPTPWTGPDLAGWLVAWTDGWTE